VNKVDLAYACQLPPEQAIAYFQQKGYTFSWDWRDTLEDAHAKAFTVAKAMRLDILQDIRAAVDKAIVQGQTFETFQRQLMPVLKSKGWWGKVMVGDGDGTGQVVQLGSPWRLRTIYQTNLQTSYMAGRYKALMADVANRPYFQYVAVLDSRTRPLHRLLHGKVFRYDDPFWRYFWPPNGWHCRCRVRALSAAEVQELGLTVENSEGLLTFEDRLINQATGETRPVAVYRTADAAGNPVIVSPDLGWNYNPGRAWQEPFVARPVDPDEIFPFKTTGTADGYAKTPLADLPAKPLTDDLLLPPHQQTGWTEIEYVNTFLKEFGAGIGNPVVFHDKVDDAVVISEELFRDRKDNTLKVFKADREMYLPLLADTIKDPVEIWLTEVRHGERVRLCKRYIGLYRSGKRNEAGFAVFDLIDGLWQGTTVFSPEKLSYLDTQRVGALLYTKK
jgi:SPP1 gp7 family putative phage head morphogenesis protein